MSLFFGHLGKHAGLRTRGRAWQFRRCRPQPSYVAGNGYEACGEPRRRGPEPVYFIERPASRCAADGNTGQIYFERCVTLLSEVEAAEAEAGRRYFRAARRSQDHDSGRVPSNPYLSPIISEFIELYPKIDLDLHFTNRVVNIMEDGFDIAIRIAESFRHNAPWPPPGGVELPHRGQPWLYRETRPA